jgi:hypothetical protein
MAIIELKGIEGDNLQTILDNLEKQRRELEYGLSHLDEENFQFSGNSFTTPNLKNGWTNYGNGTAAIGYTKNPFNEVQFRGSLEGTTNNSDAFTLPSNIAPPNNLYFPVPCGDGLQFGYVSVYASGNVTINVPSTTELTWVSLDSIKYSL